MSCECELWSGNGFFKFSFLKICMCFSYISFVFSLERSVLGLLEYVYWKLEF